MLKKRKSKEKYVAMVWIDYKNTLDMVPQYWIIDCQKMYKISDKAMKSIMEAMKTGKWNR